MNEHTAISHRTAELAQVNLLAEADEPRRAFLRGRWFTAADDPTLDVSIAREAHGRPLAALPLVSHSIGPFSVKQVAGAYWPFRGVPTDRSASVEDLALALDRQAVRRALGQVWRMGPVVADDPAVVRLRDAAKVAGWQCLERAVGTLFCLDLVALRASGNWPSTKGKQKDRWRLRQLEKTGPVTIRTYTGLDWTGRDRDAIAAIEGASWVGQLEKGGDTKFLDPQLRQYWERAATDPVIAAMIRGAILWVGNTPAAFTFGLEAGDTRYCIANNFDKQFNKFSPGRVLLYHDFEDAAERGFARIDWGLGDGGYKSQMGAHQDAAMVDLLFVRNRVLASIAGKLWQRG
ncbi:GNAT family N-acetyltransferase [Alteriqipengyuania lutimaris]|uniref:GNAT family N-acetyltransferase n=1 Tax=Alteriqipengyuania lutimaris TaxID=1538146 RepID=A0A395LLX1_9SPHN|nr:GNAT family N-acetyltransferase [Alteriqipengyuania lutimaris]MBB3033244.1 CelD/BcsL family acetyltransferase involved in cellulose biosynthesis [Alteriqipengyuania lutimaris]RDS77709.1 GNAT family N-acetyltransferase [Alteriqipengyuania lutimaris]